MSVLPVGFGSSGGIDTGDIPASLRFRTSASPSISKTFSGSDNSKCTISLLVKRNRVDQIDQLFEADTSSRSYIAFENGSGAAGNALSVWVGGAVKLTTSALYRDVTNFLHICLGFDGSAAGGTLTLEVNGTVVGSATGVGATTKFCSAVAHLIGRNSSGSSADIYISRVAVVSGQKLSASSFGELNTTINEWVSLSQSAVKAVVDAGGTNSFMLDFDDATSLTTLGYDLSTKGNNWTLNNFSITAGSSYDHMLDVPGNSFATLNPIYPSAASITNANLTSATTAVRATQDALLYDCKWEVTAGASAVTAGVISATGTTNTTSVTANKTFAFRLTTAGALDYKNVTDAGSWTSITTGLTGEQYPYGITQAANWNFGQAPLHASATYQSAAGGYFYDTTAGYKALCQRNLETPAILNPEDHHVDIAVTKSGDTNFTLPWDADTYDTFFEIKRRDLAGDWYQIDGLRGYTKILKSNSTAAETTDANVLGISGTTGTLKSTLADGTYIVSATKAGLSASRQTNTDGSITSTVSRNVDSGFAIVLYDATGANATVGHGLGAAVAFIQIKGRFAATSWPVWHKGIANTEVLLLNSTNAKGTDTAAWNSTSPNSTVFSLGSGASADTNQTNASANDHVAYCYADSAIQKSFSYTGNGSADGAYADVGFKMGRGLLKCSTTTGNWTVLDSVRSDSNVADDVIYENLTNAEATSALADLNSRAIKFRITTDPNSAQTFIGHAWAAVNGKYSLSR